MKVSASFTEHRFFKNLSALDGSGLCFTASWDDVVEAAWTEQSSRLFGRVGEQEVHEFLLKVSITHGLTVTRNVPHNTFTICEKTEGRS